jgi:hypothetical protein
MITQNCGKKFTGRGGDCLTNSNELVDFVKNGFLSSRQIKINRRERQECAEGAESV